MAQKGQTKVHQSFFQGNADLRTEIKTSLLQGGSEEKHQNSLSHVKCQIMYT